MSAPDRAADVRFARVPADVVEVIAKRGRHRDVIYAGRSRQLPLPTVGTVEWSDAYLTFATRPDRWWIVMSVGPCGEAASRIGALLGTGVVAVDHSSGYDLIDLVGAAWRSLLACGCRIDLDANHFQPGQVAATVLAQVPIMLVPHPSGIFLLSPSTYTVHLEAWLSRLCASTHPHTETRHSGASNE